MPEFSLELAIVIGAAVIVALFVLLVFTVVLALRAVLGALNKVTELAMADQQHKAEILRMKREDREARMMMEHMKGKLRDVKQVEQMLEQWAWTRTPMVAAISGFIGTMVTGLIVTLIVAAFVRKKD